MAKARAILLNTERIDIYELLRMGCAEAKKLLGIRQHVTPIDFIRRPYGYIVVVEYEESSGVRGRKMSAK